ncbi:hypothetical protein AAFF_G00063740 [Aldrovandia affinis]|uniref:Uncharacterized protein n=1 Tax=Aldrovandia affinis TaxID=143900 RepID=A0AAD7T3P0_9TELE|nr:hypothetical protein AAFF_G00063740 [Aldrovandia affinis]
MEENHTAANIAQRLGEVADAYGIPASKRVAVVHDNAANMVLCADILGTVEEWGQVKGVRTFPHGGTVTITILANLKHRHLAIAEDDSPTTKSLKAKLVEEIDHRWQINDRLFESSLNVQAAVVDPRFKQFHFLDDGKGDEAYICVSQLADRLNTAQRPEQGQAAG